RCSSSDRSRPGLPSSSPCSGVSPRGSRCGGAPSPGWPSAPPPAPERSGTFSMAERPDDGLLLGSDGLRRCWWQAGLPDYQHYHDEEWGRPVTEDQRLFEKLCLEGFQAGLSWLTILRKRENFRRAFHGFDFARVAR